MHSDGRMVSSALSMIPEQKSPPNHTICNHRRPNCGISDVTTFPSDHLDMELPAHSGQKSTEKTGKSRTSNESNNHLQLSVSSTNSNNSSENDVSDAVFHSNTSPCDKSPLFEKLSFSNQRKSRSSFNGHKPAEVFRKDLISAMKIADTAPLPCEDYWVMQDSWKMDWEKGVQVPVNYNAIPQITVRRTSKKGIKDFRMPRKMIKAKPKPGDKVLVDWSEIAESICRYDLDGLDVHWLEILNEERNRMGMPSLDEYSMERIMETLENQCYDNIQLAIQTKEGLGIEYDEDVVCDVCRQPYSEEENEMVFCDGCNVAVHQACYGILKVPEGSWLCKPCILGMRGTAECVLCGHKGGAMKSTRSGHTWAHVICALWIPEISFGDPVRMEPIAKVSNIPPSRWALLCCICKDRLGACIQCSVKQCVTAYHVTCAVEAKLDMHTDCDSNVTDSEGDSVVFRSFCKKHSKNRKESAADASCEKRGKRQNLIKELGDEFYTFVKPSVIESNLQLPIETVQQVSDYWKLKRKANFNKPLIVPKNEEGVSAAEAAEANLKRRLRLFTHIRQDLERVRNLCYMVCRREKFKSSAAKNMENVFLTQMKILEYRMKLGHNMQSPRTKSLLEKSGNPQVCEIARRESNVLHRTKYWSRSEEPDSLSTRATKPKKKSVQAVKQERPCSSDESFNSPSVQNSIENKMRNSLRTDVKTTKHLSAKRASFLKRRRVRKSSCTSRSSSPANTPLTSRKHRLLASPELDLETENQIPSAENEPNTHAKQPRMSEGHLYEANFILTDENKSSRNHASILSHASTLNSNVESSSGKAAAATTKNGDLRTKLDRKSPRSCRNATTLKRQLRLRRKSSYFSAKPYQCYVMY